MVSSNIYAGADIVVWPSSDSGLNWSPMQNELPDPRSGHTGSSNNEIVMGTTHDRGVYEIEL